MGGGKTYTALAVIDTLLELGEVSKVLIVAPLRVARMVWPEQSAQWTPHNRCRFIGGVGRDIRLSAMRDPAPMHSINYEQLPWLTNVFENAAWSYDMIVCDEAQRLRGFRGSFQTNAQGTTFLRRGGTDRSSALARAAWRARHFLELSGTPSTNGLTPLWAQTWFLDGGQRLGRTYSAFERRWFAPNWNGYGVRLRDDKAGEEIHQRVSDLFLSVSLESELDMKEPLINDVMVELPADARRQYDSMFRHLRSSMAEGVAIKAANRAVAVGKLLQIANGAVYDSESDWHEVHSEKLDAVESILEESAGAPIMCVYNWRHDLQRLMKRFPQGRELRSDDALSAFKAGQVPIGFIHPDSAGHGLNLADNCCTAVMFGQTWNTESTLQVLERIGPARQAQLGLGRVVTIHRILAKDTMDSAVIARGKTNISVQQALMDYMEA